ncbi:MAG TPA: DUF5916 domain-containing protein [Thermoanaerobaculia bacterium]|nr:DUF5916 domain-containing protein [Thermoanaerobaculia bacterium]
MRLHNRLSTALLVTGALTAALLAAAPPAAAAAEGSITRGRPIEIVRLTAPVQVDGDLSDAGWQGVAEIADWYETNPGDNVPSEVDNVAWLAYDERYLYAAFRFEDPEPGSIRAPLGDRDNVPFYTDYGGLIVDTRNDGRTAMMFLANPRGIQYDAINSDAAGEDSSPDFYWDSAASVTENGWVLELRVPFSTLRYQGQSPEMGVLLYRNWPRDFRTQMFAGQLPRDEDCFICHSHPVSGFEGLPDGGSLIVAPYATGGRTDLPEGELGSRLEEGDYDGDAGLDVKWSPTPDLTLDATLNPDFSQIESDVPQIAANERFALFFPEKRPFFLEGVDLFSSAINAVYTRSITEPDWGARATGRLGKTQYTLLVADDRGGGSVIIPGPNGSSFADQDFDSTVFLGRVRHDLGDSFVSFIASGREIEGGAYNRLFGPDFRWRPTAQDTITGQLLFSRSETPNRPDLADEWDGRELEGHAARLWWYHGTPTWDWYLSYWDFDDEFRADNGFVPQVGYREGYAELGRTFRPENDWVRRVRLYLFSDYTQDRDDGNLLFSTISPGFGLDGRWSSFVRIRGAFDRVESGGELFDLEKLHYTVELTPSRKVSRLQLFGDWGDQVDFANDRLGSGGTVSMRADLRPTDHLQLELQADRRWIDLDRASAQGRLFTADLARLRAQYTLSARSYVRLIGQWSEVERDPSLYFDEVSEKSGGLSGSLLFAYKLNWQTVLFVGYADNRQLALGDQDPRGRRDESFEPSDRQFFLKVSYAFQR